VAENIVLSIREENPEEAELRKWFEQQALASPANLEEAARLIIGLVSGLLGILFGVLALEAEKLPAYLALPAVRGLAIAAIILWLAALTAGLVVVLPQRWEVNPAKPDSQAQVFQQILHRKRSALTISGVAFGLAIAALGGVLVLAMLFAA
jgi:hypothetical protein